MLETADIARLDRMIELLTTRQPAQIAAEIVPDAAESLMARCTIDHGALMVFPVCHQNLLDAMRERGFTPNEIVPSTVVRERIHTRYALAVAPEVHIVHALAPERRGWRPELEIFLASAALAEVARCERVDEAETHLAVTSRVLDEDVVRDIRALLLAAGMVPDGGGINPFANDSVMYFRSTSAVGWIRRLELVCHASLPDLVAEHLAEQTVRL